MLKDKELKDRIIEDHEGSSANSDMTLDRLRGRIEKIAAANSVPVDLAIDEFLPIFHLIGQITVAHHASPFSFRLSFSLSLLYQPRGKIATVFSVRPARKQR